jgi:hypothetical protein
MEYDFERLEVLLAIQNQHLENLFIGGLLIFGSIVFLHFSRFLRW